MVTITAKKDGFRRCGIAHTSKPTEYEVDRFSAQELAQLRTEPMLVVEVMPTLESAKPPTAQALATLIGEAETLEAVDALIAEDEKRATVLGAAEKRRAELT
ncbi:MAG: HI1506-related protein [Desulfuromonadaceae bacterium]|nr:HI1506-related protein [Desulfuromonadaceae bacterium]